MALLGAGALVAVMPALGDTIVYNLTDCFVMSGNCPPPPSSASSYGTVTVTSLSTDEVSVTVALSKGEVFAFGGAGKPLLFDINGNPTISASDVTGLPTNFTFTQQAMTMADGTGKWNYFIDCPSCTGTSNPGVPTTISFDITYTGGITPQDFVTNSHKPALFFATDVGVPTASGFSTGDTAAPAAMPVPLPPSLVLLGSALAAIGWMLRRQSSSPVLRLQAA